MNIARKTLLPLVLLPAFSAVAQSVSIQFVNVSKGISYVQTSAGTAIVDPTPTGPMYGGPYGFGIDVDGINIGALTPTPTITSSPIRLNIGGPNTAFHNGGKLVYNSNDDAWEYGFPNANDWGSPNQTLNDSYFPSGTYTVVAGGATFPLALTGDAYPTTPVATLSGGYWSGGKYYIYANQPLTVTSNAFTGYGTHANDVIGFNVGPIEVNQALRAVPVFNPTVTTANTLTTTVPANTLKAGQQYDASLFFIAAVDVNTTALAGCYAYASYEKSTDFTVVVLAPTGVVPGVTVPRLVPPGATLVDARALTTTPTGAVLVALSGSYAVRPTSGGQALSFPDYTNPQPYNLSYVVRLLANGQPDPAFTSAPGGDGTVNTVTVQPDGKILVGGTFASFNGVFFKNLARLQADGKADATFTIGSGPDAQVNAIAVQDDGKILVGGAFQNFGGQSRPYLLRLSATGAVDTAFASALNGLVDAIVVQPDGKIFIGGNFTSAGGTTRNRIARLLATGAVDSTFDPGAGANDEVVTLRLQSNGAIVAGGDFTSFGGQSRGRIARILATGALDTSFLSSATANSTVISLGLEASGNIVLGGAFTQVNGVARNRLARLLPAGAIDLTFDPAAGANKDVHAILPRNDGSIFLGGIFDQYQGTAVNEVVAVVGTPVATAFVQPPRSLTVAPGGTARFIGDATGPALSYQWYKDDVAIAGATSGSLTLTNVAASAQGRYTLKVLASGETVFSGDATLTVAGGAPGQIVNLSVLTSLDASGDTFTVGFVVGGTGTSGAKPLLVRAAGPALAAFGVGNPLADPKLQFFAGPTLAGENDNWGGTPALSGLIAQVGAFAYTNAGSKDAAFAPQNLTTASNSVIVSGVGAATGAVIAEVYDATPAASVTATTPRLINVSVLKNIPASANLTAGFVIGGSTSKTVLVRVIGPTLASFGVGGPMADPQLVLFNGATQIATNDNWGGSAVVRDAMSAVGAFALDPLSKDAALLITLQPGSYSVQASGVGSTAGAALVEVYEVP